MVGPSKPSNGREMVWLGPPHQERSADDRGSKHFHLDPTIVPLKLAGSPLSSAAVSEPTNAALGAGNLIYRNYQTNPDTVCFQQHDMPKKPKSDAGPALLGPA